MKTLLVLRHAKAEADAPSGSDFDRRLTSRGHRDSAAVGRALRTSGCRLDAILASPAARVVETVDGLVQAAGFELAAIWDRRLYNAPPQTLLEAIRGTEAAVETLLIVAHNPGLPELILHLATANDLRDRVAGGFQTAALAELRLAVDRWADAGARCGRIVSLERPSKPAPPE